MQPNLSLPHFSQHGTECNQIFLTTLNMGKHATKSFSTSPLSTWDSIQRNFSLPDHSQTQLHLLYLIPLKMGQHAITSFSISPLSTWDSIQPHLSPLYLPRYGTACNHILNTRPFLPFTLSSMRSLMGLSLLRTNHLNVIKDLPNR